MSATEAFDRAGKVHEALGLSARRRREAKKGRANSPSDLQCAHCELGRRGFCGRFLFSFPEFHEARAAPRSLRWLSTPPQVLRLGRIRNECTLPPVMHRMLVSRITVSPSLRGIGELVPGFFTGRGEKTYWDLGGHMSIFHPIKKVVSFLPGCWAAGVEGRGASRGGATKVGSVIDEPPIANGDDQMR